MPAAGINEAQCGEAVKPSVGGAIDQACSVGISELPQSRYLWRKGREEVRSLSSKNEVQLARHRLDKLPTDGRSERLEAGCVHRLKG